MNYRGKAAVSRPSAGIADAKIIVAGPFPISGTAALVGTLKAYEEMTGKKLDDKVTDAAMDQLVTARLRRG